MKKNLSNLIDSNLDSASVKNIARRSFTIRLGSGLFQRFNKHLVLLKRIQKVKTKQNWLEDAIQKKFEHIKKLDLMDDVGDKFVTVKLEKTMADDIEKKIEELRKIGIEINKKQLFLEAIREKLSAEEKEVQQKAQALLRKMISE